MKKIFKYPLEVIDFQILGLPRGAKLLSVQVQHGQPCVWALVDLDEKREPVSFKTMGTGHPFEDSDDWEHLSTYQLEDGMLVFHVFVSKKPSELKAG